MNEVTFNGVFGQQGWICPKCGRVYSPYTQMCTYCVGNNQINAASSLDEILEADRMEKMRRIKENEDLFKTKRDE